MKKFISILSLICLICIVFPSCAKDNGANNNNNPVQNNNASDSSSSETTTEDPFDPNLPAADYGGYSFRILNVDEGALWWSIANIDAAEQNGDVVNDAIYTRNRNIEDKYNFTLKEIRMSDSALNSALKKSVNAGTDDYDLVLPITTSAPSHAQNHLLVDLYKIPNLDFNRAWWDNSISKNFSVNNKLFFACSNFILTPEESAAIMMYNKKIAESLGIDSAESLYSLVDEGNWTIDKFTQLCRDGSADLNGNGKADAMDDRFGLITCDWLYEAFLGGFGETLVSKDDKDMPYLSCRSERFLNAYEKITDFMLQRDIVVREAIDFKGTTEDVFVKDGALFCGEVLSCVRIFKNMGSDFGVLPLPKFDESQNSYHTYTLVSTCIGVPATNTNLDRTGTILEALSAESRRLVIPAYYDIALNAKYLRDEGSLHMLDVILNNKIYDVADSSVMYNWGGLSEAVKNLSKKGGTDLSSLIDKYETKTLADIQKTVDAYNAQG